MGNKTRTKKKNPTERIEKKNKNKIKENSMGDNNAASKIKCNPALSL